MIIDIKFDILKNPTQDFDRPRKKLTFIPDNYKLNIQVYRHFENKIFLRYI